MWISPWAALVHRRLIVVDPRGGGQPMVRKRGKQRYILVYNGELYNTNELRRELEQRGHIFRSLRHRGAAPLLHRVGKGVSSGSTASLPLASGMKPNRACSWRATDWELNRFSMPKETALSSLARKSRHSWPIPRSTRRWIARAGRNLCHGSRQNTGTRHLSGIKELKPGYWLIYDRRGSGPPLIGGWKAVLIPMT